MNDGHRTMQDELASSSATRETLKQAVAQADRTGAAGMTRGGRFRLPPAFKLTCAEDACDRIRRWRELVKLVAWFSVSGSGANTRLHHPQNATKTKYTRQNLSLSLTHTAAYVSFTMSYEILTQCRHGKEFPNHFSLNVVMKFLRRVEKF